MTELLAALLLALGSLFSFGAGLGMIRFPDLYTRMHASTKAGTLGVGLILAAVAVHFGDLGAVARAVAAIAFLFVTAPVSGHMIGRAAYRSGVRMWGGSVVDEYEGRGSFSPVLRSDDTAGGFAAPVGVPPVRP